LSWIFALTSSQVWFECQDKDSEQEDNVKAKIQDKVISQEMSK